VHARPGHQRRVLEHHREPAAGTADRFEVLAPPADPPAGRRDEAGDHPEQRRLPAARRPEHGHELAGADREVDRIDRARAVGVGLRDRAELDDRRPPGGGRRRADCGALLDDVHGRGF
jgi:hypothetical protein